MVHCSFSGYSLGYAAVTTGEKGYYGVGLTAVATGYEGYGVACSHTLPSTTVEHYSFCGYSLRYAAVTTGEKGYRSHRMLVASRSKASCSNEHLLVLLHSCEITHGYVKKMLEAPEKCITGTVMH